MPVGSTNWCGNEGAAQARQRTCVVVRGSRCSVTDCPGKRFEYKDCVLCCSESVRVFVSSFLLLFS